MAIPTDIDDGGEDRYPEDPQPTPAQVPGQPSLDDLSSEMDSLSQAVAGEMEPPTVEPPAIEAMPEDAPTADVQAIPLEDLNQQTAPTPHPAMFGAEMDALQQAVGESPDPALAAPDEGSYGGPPDSLLGYLQGGGNIPSMDSLSGIGSGGSGGTGGGESGMTAFLDADYRHRDVSTEMLLDHARRINDLSDRLERGRL